MFTTGTGTTSTDAGQSPALERPAQKEEVTIDAYEDYEHAGLRVRVYQDPDPPNPREDFSCATTMVTRHRRYTLGDVQLDDFTSADEWIADNKPRLVKPLYLYDHSGISIS